MPTTSDELKYSTMTRIAGQDELYAVDVLRKNSSNRLAVNGDSGRWYTDVSAGLISGVQYEYKFGFHDNVSQTGWEDIWDIGTEYVWPTTASTISISSNNASDTLADTGARVIILYGLDANYQPVSEQISLNGTTAVTTTNTFLRSFRAIVIAAGSVGSNVGTITATHNGTTQPIWAILPTENQTAMTQYTVAASKTLFINSYYYTLRTGKSTKLRLRVRPFGSTFQTKLIVETDTSERAQFLYPFVVPEKADIVIQAIASTGSHAVAAGWGATLINNSELGA